MKLTLERDEGNIVLDEDVLVFVIDDTGHEDLHDANGSGFGIAGCAFMVRDYWRLIDGPWTYMLGEFFPDITRPVHATDNLRNLTEVQYGALTHFFTKFEFFRLATVVGKNAANLTEAGFVEIVSASLLEHVKRIAGYASFSRVVMLFEASERMEAKVMRELASRKLVGNGRETPIEIGTIPKKSCMSALEVADVIAHTALGQTRHRNTGKAPTFRKDFVDIFKSVDTRLVHFMEITEVK